MFRIKILTQTQMQDHAQIRWSLSKFSFKGFGSKLDLELSKSRRPETVRRSSMENQHGLYKLLYIDVLSFYDTRVIHNSAGNHYINASYIVNASSKILQRLLQLNVKYVELKEPPLSILHFQYADRPDHGVPKSTKSTKKIV